MSALFFGDSSEPLFGVYHEPAGEPRGVGVLLCPSIGHEYMRGHWALKRLAVRLAAGGFPVLRFDYYGVGDSAGETGAGNPERWMRDIRTAARELCDIAAVPRVSFAGLRLGATLAAALVADGAAVQDLILWDPVVSGSSFLVDLVTLQSTRTRQFVGRRSRRSAAPDIGLLGFPYPAELRSAIGALDLRAVPFPDGARTHVIVSSEGPETNTLKDRLSARNALAAYRHVADYGNWDSEAWAGRALLADTILTSIAGLLEGRSA